MIATEEVAKTKWCPHVRKSNYQRSAAINRSESGEPLVGAKCVASECMAWKWANGFSPEELEARSVYNPNPDVPKGYCGA